MSRVTETATEFTILTPPQLPLVLHGLHALALLACGLNGLAVVYRCLLALLVAGSWLKNSIVLARSRPSYLRYTAAQCWYISYDGQEYIPIVIEPDTALSNILLVVRYRLSIADTVKSRSLLITRHSMPITHFRRLLVRLTLSRIDRDR